MSEEQVVVDSKDSSDFAAWQELQERQRYERRERHARKEMWYAKHEAKYRLGFVLFGLVSVVWGLIQGNPLIVATGVFLAYVGMRDD